MRVVEDTHHHRGIVGREAVLHTRADNLLVGVDKASYLHIAVVGEDPEVDLEEVQSGGNMG